jgi:RNA polymerase II subunit A C-terminal domain phosphatase
MIIPVIRQMTFTGLKIVFSSVIPLDVPPEATDIWRTAVAFGAECYKELNPMITHVVANKVGSSRLSPGAKTDGLLPSFRI